MNSNEMKSSCVEKIVVLVNAFDCDEKVLVLVSVLGQLVRILRKESEQEVRSRYQVDYRRRRRQIIQVTTELPPLIFSVRVRSFHGLAISIVTF